MDIKTYDKTIRELLASGRQFLIPRFQREYSWDKKNYKEFFEDMLNTLTIKNGAISPNQYFLGTMLFIGNFAEGSEQKIQVVDGQQRLTTITILFSALSDRFREINEDTLSEQIFKYIMTKDDNGGDIRVLKSKTHYPFFSYFIQDRTKDDSQDPETEEEFTIKETFDYFFQQLSGEKLKEYLKRRHGNDIVAVLSYVDILKALRDQVLNSTFVAICTKDQTQANTIFEILNAKGKRLAHIDLIKNKIFEVLKNQEPADFAEDRWQKIKKTLSTGKETVGLATFYRHYWISKYKKTTSTKLYDDFNSTVVPKSEECYKQFLDDMLLNATYYTQIVNPKREDYSNRKEYYWLVQSLNAINNYFNVVQARIALLALYDLKHKSIIDMSLFKSTIIYLENFHFAYNAIFSGRANQLEKIYSSFSIEARKATTKEMAASVIKNKLIKPLDRLYPSFDEFKPKFLKLSFSKKERPSNSRTKYAINKLNCYFSKNEIFEDDGSVEHICAENLSVDNLKIGNLILLEQKVNIEAGQQEYLNKKALYEKSNYKWIHKFIENYPNWDNSMFDKRASDLAEIYYTKILGREI